VVFVSLFYFFPYFPFFRYSDLGSNVALFFLPCLVLCLQFPITFRPPWRSYFFPMFFQPRLLFKSLTLFYFFRNPSQYEQCTFFPSPFLSLRVLPWQGHHHATAVLMCAYLSFSRTISRTHPDRSLPPCVFSTLRFCTSLYPFEWNYPELFRCPGFPIFFPLGPSSLRPG